MSFAHRFSLVVVECEELGVRAVALDVHRDFCEVAIVADGQLRSAGRIQTRPDALELFAQILDERVSADLTPRGKFEANRPASLPSQSDRAPPASAIGMLLSRACASRTSTSGRPRFAPLPSTNVAGTPDIVNDRAMDRLRRKLWVAYAGLVVAAAVMLAVTELAADDAFLTEYGPNFVAELAGILLTVVLVDRLLGWQHERRLQPLREAAVRRVRRPIVSLLWLVARMREVAVARGGEAPSTWAEVLSPTAMEAEVDYARLDLESPAPTAHRQRWADYAASVTAGFEEAFLADVDRYAEVLSRRLVLAGHNVLEDVVFKYLMQFPQLQALGEQQGMSLGPTLPPLVAHSVPELIEHTRELVAAYDELVRSDDRLAEAQPS